MLLYFRGEAVENVGKILRRVRKIGNFPAGNWASPDQRTPRQDTAQTILLRLTLVRCRVLCMAATTASAPPANTGWLTARRRTCHMATGLRSEESIWCQWRSPFPTAQLPATTCPSGRSPPPAVTPNTVSRSRAVVRLGGGTLKITDSLKIGPRSLRFSEVRFFRTLRSLSIR